MYVVGLYNSVSKDVKLAKPSSMPHGVRGRDKLQAATTNYICPDTPATHLEHKSSP